MTFGFSYVHYFDRKFDTLLYILNTIGGQVNAKR